MSQTIVDFNNDYTGIRSIRLAKNLYLEEGLINNTSPSIDVTLGGLTTLFTAPASGITGIDISNFKFRLLGNNTTGNLQLSIGTNGGGGANNILATITMTGFNTIGDMWRASLNTKFARIAPGDTVSVNIVNPVTGAGAIIEVYAVGEIIS